MEGGFNAVHRSGLARVLFAACLLLTSISLAVVGGALLLSGPASFFSSLMLALSLLFALSGFGFSLDGFRMMLRNHS